MPEQHLRRLPRELPLLLPQFPAGLGGEMRGEDPDILLSLPEGRHEDGEDVQPEEEILPEPP
ncbi:MAG TPA: hypothetical protein DD658_09595, partial [Deltaproteobacteria bacterium]|nr:hypothetical protein [Deltaproteobacteria bacterium]